ncbi:hypothetical protein [Actinokineospora sp. NPDC004072]
MAVTFGGRLFVLARGAGDRAHLLVCSTDGWGWTASVRIGRGESVRASTAPAVVVFGGRLHVFFRGESAASTLYTISTANGREWGDRINLTEATRGARTAGPPFPVVFGDRLVVLMRDPANSRIGLCRSIDGTNWSRYGTIAGSGNEEHPVAVVHGSRLFVFSQGLGGMVCAASCEPDGTWVEHGALPRSAHWPPVPVSVGDRLVLLTRDYLDPRELAATDVETGVDTPIGVARGAPAAVARGDQTSVVYPSADGLNAVDLASVDACGERAGEVRAAGLGAVGPGAVGPGAAELGAAGLRAAELGATGLGAVGPGARCSEGRPGSGIGSGLALGGRPGLAADVGAAAGPGRRAAGVLLPDR